VGSKRAAETQENKRTGAGDLFFIKEISYLTPTIRQPFEGGKGRRGEDEKKFQITKYKLQKNGS